MGEKKGLFPMKYLRLSLSVLIAANWILALGHLFVVQEMLPSPEFKLSWVGAGLITAGHLIMAASLWRLSNKWAGGILTLFWCAAMAAGVYEHFLQVAPNNIFRAPSGNWTALFDASVFALLIVEAGGLWLAIRLLGSGLNLKTFES
jgi:hypothetical protein